VQRRTTTSDLELYCICAVSTKSKVSPYIAGDLRGVGGIPHVLQDIYVSQNEIMYILPHVSRNWAGPPRILQRYQTSDCCGIGIEADLEAGTYAEPI
jgi:hypothetical protein